MSLFCFIPFDWHLIDTLSVFSKLLMYNYMPYFHDKENFNDEGIRPSSFSSSFSIVRPTQICGIFKPKKGNDVVKLFFA